MNPEDITLILGVDAAHREELRWTWPTWMRFKPELRQMPAVVFFDSEQITLRDLDFLGEHPNLRAVPWTLPNAWHQREKMLTGFVQVPAREVATPWYLKLDTDVVATGPGRWIDPEWFVSDATGALPVFVTNRWHYSKPRYVMDLLDDWADRQPCFAGTRRLNLPYTSNRNKLLHPRIISWLFFGRTDWTRQIATLAAPDGRLPYPSQDSFVFYCAERMGCRHVRTRMCELHWTHQRFRRIRELVKTLGMRPAAT